MAKAGFCRECRRDVWLTPEGGCVRGHAVSAIKDVHDVAVGARDDGRRQVAGDGTHDPIAVVDAHVGIEAYRRDRRSAGQMTITTAQPMRAGSHGGRLEPSPTLTIDEARREARRFLAEPATFTLEPVCDHEPFTHHLRIIDGPPELCRDYLVQVEKGP